VFKRGFDIFFASVLLALTFPLLAIAAILIKMDSSGPVIFRQNRMGRRYMRFTLFKLRTMNLSGEGPDYTLGADPRITRVGHWLRRYKIDELPQLWNVLRGEMSIVGPRPVIPQLAIEFDWGYARLLAVRPGLTDPASLKYSEEAEILAQRPDAERYFKEVITPDKIRISIAYLRSASRWSDLVVVTKTALALASSTLRRRFGQAVPGQMPTPQRMLRFPDMAMERAARLRGAKGSQIVEREIGPTAVNKGGIVEAAAERDSIPF
jgi:lipopolysaccharide/colanic/teichoic acid biosynthesis glycosyltransferase